MRMDNSDRCWREALTGRPLSMRWRLRNWWLNFNAQVTCRASARPRLNEADDSLYVDIRLIDYLIVAVEQVEARARRLGGLWP
jgi:hypothetical protein